MQIVTCYDPIFGFVGLLTVDNQQLYVERPSPIRAKGHKTPNVGATRIQVPAQRRPLEL